MITFKEYLDEVRVGLIGSTKMRLSNEYGAGDIAKRYSNPMSDDSIGMNDHKFEPVKDDKPTLPHLFDKNHPDHKIENEWFKNLHPDTQKIEINRHKKAGTFQ